MSLVRGGSAASYNFAGAFAEQQLAATEYHDHASDDSHPGSALRFLRPENPDYAIVHFGAACSLLAYQKRFLELIFYF